MTKVYDKIKIYNELFYNPIIYIMSSEPTHTYLDINLCNNKVDNEQSPIPIIFTSRRDKDYLTYPRDYLCTVARWSLDCRLPVIVPQLKLNVPPVNTPMISDIWATVYVITFSDNSGYSMYDNIYFIPQIAVYQTPPVAVVTNLSQLYDNPYFHINSANYFIDIINTSIASTYTLFLTNAGLNGNPNYPNDPPFFKYDGGGNVSLCVCQNFLNYLPNGQPNPYFLKMFFNGALNTLFNGLPTLINSESNPPLNLHYQVFFNYNLPQLISSPPSLVAYYVLSNEYKCVPFWSPLASIVFTTAGGIPVEPSNSPPTVIIGSSASLNNNNINLSPVITDFDINFVTGLESRQINYYTPTGEYRLIDLVSNRPLNDINISVFWRDKIQGNLHRLYLHSGGGASLKLLFRKRDFFSENL
jgi:hypothetical protein